MVILNNELIHSLDLRVRLRPNQTKTSGFIFVIKALAHLIGPTNALGNRTLRLRWLVMTYPAALVQGHPVRVFLILLLVPSKCLDHIVRILQYALFKLLVLGLPLLSGVRCPEWCYVVVWIGRHLHLIISQVAHIQRHRVLDCVFFIFSTLTFILIWNFFNSSR